MVNEIPERLDPPNRLDLLREYERRKQVKYWVQEITKYSVGVASAEIDDKERAFQAQQLEIAGYFINKYSITNVSSEEINVDDVMSFFPEAFAALPESYQNNSVLKFFFRGNVLCTAPIKDQEQFLGSWISFFNPRFNKWSD